ncbi:hypothetical protein RRG08_019955 [Elysia crispata]|uniref:Uncharacterized protein n=1 Tax=Elysia crispata TaxID=231223 RepID=A0AAE0Y8V3_9GAST|nr:hypothetical protein RRG08_019955 [Elysia crispata]
MATTLPGLSTQTRPHVPFDSPFPFLRPLFPFFRGTPGSANVTPRPGGKTRGYVFLSPSLIYTVRYRRSLAHCTLTRGLDQLTKLSHYTEHNRAGKVGPQNSFIVDAWFEPATN